ncbi:surface-adhesin E family protein [uncultured Phascolarctobacterium sp.]|uniref:surface-adhesin E family protein n=1 Tax=uncultured Phascolarctobacterium sp. TaxID=512296 RepID=UPI0025D1214A|nr:surface-adhesin E family protein [uncultured Phascolarctobacterium sp.]
MMKKFIVSLLSLFMFFGIIPASYAANWQWITSTDTITYSFDSQSIRQIAPGKYFVWVKNEFTEAAGKQLSADLNFKKPVAFSLHRSEYNCINEFTGMQSYAYYAKDGSILAQGTDNYYSYSPIIPGTIGEMIFLITFSKRCHISALSSCTYDSTHNTVFHIC